MWMFSSGLTHFLSEVERQIHHQLGVEMREEACGHRDRGIHGNSSARQVKGGCAWIPDSTEFTLWMIRQCGGTFFSSCIQLHRYKGGLDGWLYSTRFIVFSIANMMKDQGKSWSIHKVVIIVIYHDIYSRYKGKGGHHGCEGKWKRIRTNALESLEMTKRFWGLEY